MNRSKIVVSLIPLILSFASEAAADDRPKSMKLGGPPVAVTGWSEEAPPPLPSGAKATASLEITSTAPSAPEVKPAQPAQPAPDRPAESVKKDALTDAVFLHGFRLGYGYINNSQKPVDSLGRKSLQARAGTKSPHNFLIGYEVTVRLMGHSWLNVILLANGILGGLEQSKFLPSGNALLGFELNNSFQLGVGAHLTPLRGQEAHVAIAGGWTPRVGNFYVPVHAFFIPDVEGVHRMGVLTGVTF